MHHQSLAVALKKLLKISFGSNMCNFIKSFGKYQHIFRKFTSVCTTLLQLRHCIRLYDWWPYRFKLLVLPVSFYLSKAFDNVDHRVLLKKPEAQSKISLAGWLLVGEKVGIQGHLSNSYRMHSSVIHSRLRPWPHLFSILVKETTTAISLFNTWAICGNRTVSS